MALYYLFRFLEASSVVKMQTRCCSSFFENRFKTLATDEVIAKIREHRRQYDRTSTGKSRCTMDLTSF